jgi:hypothetical protein
MLVSGLDSTGSLRDRVGYVCDHGESREYTKFEFQILHDLALMSEYVYVQQESSKDKQRSWYV